MDHRQLTERKTAEGYVLEELSEPEREEFEEHFFSCEECADEVKAAARFADNAKAVFGEDAAKVVAFPKPVRESPKSARWFRAVPWAATAAFAMLSSYQGFLVIPRLAGPQVASAVTLIEETRGELDQHVRRNGSFVPLRFDINTGQPSPRYVCELHKASGALVFTTEGDAPPEGQPMILLAPAAKLKPDSYILVVKRPGPAGSEVGRFSFVVDK